MAALLSHAALTALMMQCAPSVAPETMMTLAGIESDGNPYSIAVIGRQLEAQPTDLKSALALVGDLERKGEDYSLGLMQIYKKNFSGLGLTTEKAFDACESIKAGAKIFSDCYERAIDDPAFSGDEQNALRGAMSCYYSNNLTRGYIKEFDGKSYVDLANEKVNKLYKVPAIKPQQQADNLQAAPAAQQKQPQRQAWDVYGDFNIY